MFPATPHPNKKFVRQMIEWAKKKDTWRDTIRPNFRRRPQEPPSALGFAWVCRRYFDVLGGRWGRDWENFRQKASPSLKPSLKSCPGGRPGGAAGVALTHQLDCVTSFTHLAVFRTQFTLASELQADVFQNGCRSSPKLVTLKLVVALSTHRHGTKNAYHLC